MECGGEARTSPMSFWDLPCKSLGFKEAEDREPETVDVKGEKWKLIELYRLPD